MKNLRFFRAPALFFLLLVSSLLSVSANEGWRQVRSKNFKLIGNADENSIRAVAIRLEQFREILGQVLGQMNSESPVPTTVIVFKNAADYKPYKPVDSKGEPREMVTGYFQAGKDVNYITLSAEGEPERTYEIIFHEYTHFLVRNNLGEAKIPAWYNEGVALYYENLLVETDENVTIGAAQTKFLNLLRQNELIPLDIFFNTDNASLHDRGEEAVGLFYAQSWLLMHYLLHESSGERASRLEKFLGSVMTGVNSKTAFQESFQIDYRTLENELKKYLLQKNFPVRRLTLKNRLNLDLAIETAPLAEPEARAHLGDLLLHLNRLPEAETLLASALMLDPKLGTANASLGLLKLKQNDLAGGIEYLEKAVAADSANYLAHFYYAYALSRVGMEGFGFVTGYHPELAGKMRASLKRSIELNPRFAEAYDLYAFVNIIRNEQLDEAIVYLDRARALAPGNQWYRIHLAELYLRKEDFARARSLASQVTETASEKELKVYALNTLQRINGTEAAYEEIKNNKNPRPTPPERELTDEELAVLRARQIMESLNESLYRTKPNERRVLGYLTGIDCGVKDKIYLFKIGDGILKLRSPSFDTVRFTAFTREMADRQVGCGAIEVAVLAVVNYRPAEDSRLKTSGEVVSIEFVPADFKFTK